MRLFKIKFPGLYRCSVFFWLIIFLVNTGLAEESKTYLKVVIVGDTGIGERAFYHGFRAVAKGMKQEKPDLLLHLGDFVYQPEIFPRTCEVQYKNDIFQYLVRPFPLHFFVPGDNDLSPKKMKPKASGCWKYIESFDAPFDILKDSSRGVPGPLEGTKTINNTFFGILNSYHEADPTPWLNPLVEKARREGKWIFFALHEPPLTTAWFKDKNQTKLKIINQMEPDFVFSGNQHSYERFHQIGVPNKKGVFSIIKSTDSKYKRGEGTIHIITGGGGATIKPFADLQGKKNKTAPKKVFDALAVRALMNHYVVLEITDKSVRGRTERVCPDMENIKVGKTNPRWKPKKKFWKKVHLSCEGRQANQDTYDEFLLVR